MLSTNDKIHLLRLARQAVESHLTQETHPTTDSSCRTEDPQQGVFVTLYKKGELRGCVGFLNPDQNLIQTVPRVAKEAAFEDPRFLPLQPDEYPDVRFEISILSPYKRIFSLDEITPGVHGVWLKKGGRSGVFLPQVWDELKDRELFLNALCSQKAGLEERCWMDPDVELNVFTVDIASEETSA